MFENDDRSTGGRLTTPTLRLQLEAGPQGGTAAGRAGYSLDDLGLLAYSASVFLATPISGFSRLTHAALLLLAACLVGTAVFRKRSLAVPRDPFLACSLAFAVVVWASVLWSTDQAVALPRAVGIIVAIVGSWLVLVGLWNGGRLGAVVLGAAIGAVVNGAVALEQFLGQGIVRATGLTGNANALALQLSLAALLAFFHARDREGAWAGRAFGIGLLGVATVVTGSRKVLVVWLILSLWLARSLAVQTRTWISRFALIFVVLPVLAGGLFEYWDLLIGVVRNLHVVQRTELLVRLEDYSSNERLAMIATGLRMWSEAPLLGYGAEQFSVRSGFGTYSHNNYIELLVNFGLIGFMAYYAGYAAIVLRAVRNRTSRWTVPLGIGLLMAWEVGLVSHSGKVYWLFLAVLAYLAARRREGALGPVGTALPVDLSAAHSGRQT